MRIDTLPRIWPPDSWAVRARTPDAAWQAAGRALAGAGWLGGWRLNGAPRLRIATDGEERSIALDAGAARAAHVAVAAGVAHVDVAGRSVPFRLAPAPDVDRAVRAAAGAHGGGPVEVVAPMPGSIVAIHATVGQAVDAADPIATLEAMKMEHAVGAPFAGRIAELRVRAGDQVARGDVLAIVEP
jgi:biotin carboxyl carrier protein